ncbi:MAG TPA: spermidine/putrescine ABC transporter substrate-binding protein, partial [Bacillota bacterium]
MKKIISLILAVMALGSAVILSGCGEKQNVLNVYNWGDYIDESVLPEFEKKFNVKINYDTFTTNEDMYVKVNAGGSHYDILVPSDYMIKRM